MRSQTCKIEEENSYDFKNVSLYDSDMNKLSGYSLSYGPFGGSNSRQISNITLTQKYRSKGFAADDFSNTLSE